MMMALTALLAASASATPQTRPAMLAKSLSLRGGSLDTPEGKFFAFSGTVASANGILALTKPDMAVKFLIPGITLQADEIVIKMLGVAMLAWGIAKFTAIRTSTEKEFSQVNLLPMLWSVSLVSSKSILAAIMQTLFAIGYAYFGYIA